MYLLASPFIYPIEIELQVSSLGQLRIYIAIHVFSSEKCLFRTCQQLFDNPMDLLLRWEYDPYALCYNGEHVYMLPRCARAIETGFTTFTTGLCWGENLAYCPSRVLSLICLARRGFGLRILPSYMRCLVEGNPETKNGRRRLPTVLRETTVRESFDHQKSCQILALESFSWLIELDETWDSHLWPLANYELYGDRISEPVLNYHYSDQVPDYEQIVADIDDFNQSLFVDLQITICRRLQISLQRFGCK